jgi:hypothetical protein
LNSLVEAEQIIETTDERLDEAECIACAEIC